ncbi:MAG: 1-acyl-sn-glycerol-3-phosphate acyltransferase [Bacteroidales bacterium]
MIIKARHHWFYYPFFKLYSRWMPRKDFSRVTLHHSLEDKKLPVLMIGNHISWWDGFLAQYINLELFHRKLHIMMLEEQLEKRMFLNKTGAYSIKKGDRSALESIRYTAEILDNPRNLVILYPQGKIHSILDLPVRFETGWYRLFRYLERPIQVVFYVALFDFFASRKPQLHMYLYDYPYRGKSMEEMNRDFNERIRESIEHQKALA